MYVNVTDGTQELQIPTREDGTVKLETLKVREYLGTPFDRQLERA